MLYQVDDYEVDLSNSLGHGTFGRVYPCRQSNSQQFDLCCKAICIESLKKNQVEYEKTQRETQIMMNLKEKSKANENVVQFYHTTQVIFENQDHILLFMERCDTDLKEYLKSNKVNIPDAVNIIKQIINGYRICYENSIMHRDLKPANILMKGNVFKLTDFGEGKIVKEIDKICQQTKVGTPIYQSPQMFKPSQEVCSAKTDIYSLGVIFYEILYASLPFAISRQGIDEFHMRLKQKIFNPPNVNHSNQPIDQQIIDLLKNMLIYSDNDRIGWQELFDHPLIKIAVQEQKDIKKIVISEMNQNKIQFKPSQVIQMQPQRLGTLQGQKINGQPFNGQPINGQPFNGQPINGQPFNGQTINRQPIQGQQINGQIPQTQNIIQPNNGINAQQNNPNFNQRLPTLQKQPQQNIQGQSSISTSIPIIGMNNSINLRTQALDSKTLIIALKFLRNFMNSFEKYGNLNPIVHEQVDQVITICKQLLTSICQQIIQAQNNQICDEQFKSFQNTLDIQQVQIFIEYSQKAREQNQNTSISDLGNQLKQMIEKVFQFFPFDKNKNYSESYVNFKINMKKIIQDKIKFTDIQACDFGTPNETYLY